MARSSRKRTDKLFGDLKWSEGSDRWETSLTIDYFRRFGANVEPTENEGDEPPQMNEEEFQKRLRELDAYATRHPRLNRMVERQKKRLIKTYSDAKKSATEKEGLDVPPWDGCIPVAIYNEALQGDIHPLQHAAWKQFLSKGDALWKKLMPQVVAEYRTHHAIRMRWWKATFGTHDLARVLPVVKNQENIKKLIRPSIIFVHEPSDKAADIGITFHTTYGEFGVLIQEGAISQFDDFKVAMRLPSLISTFHHDRFGTFELFKPDGAWAGRVPLPSFCDYRDIAQTRVRFQNNPKNIHATEYPLPWDFAHGRFQLMVETEPDALPEESQFRAVSAFLENERENVGKISDAVLQHYKSHFSRYRKGFEEGHVEEVIPVVKSRDDMQELMELVSVHVMPAASDKPACLEFIISCSGAPTCLRVRWCNSELIGVVPSS